MDGGGVNETTLATQIEIEANIRPSLSIADYQNGLSLLHGLSVINPALEPFGAMDLMLTCDPPVFRPRTWRLDSLSSGSTAISSTDLQIDARVLTGLTERATATVTITLQNSTDTSIITESIHNVDLLPKTHWGGLSANLPEIIAAFSQPNDPNIDRLLKQAADVLRQAGRPNQLNGYIDGPAHAWQIANAIWIAVVSQRFTYILPPKGFEESGQKIRTPESMIQSRLGTCLDLTMLFVALMEQASLHSVIVFTRGHAFPGFWTTAKPISSSTIDDPAQIRNAIELNELVLFESTLVTQSDPVSFSDAITTGAKNVAVEVSESFHLAVDVHQARKSGIRPLTSSDATHGGDDIAPEKLLEVLTLEPIPEELLSEPATIVDAAPTTAHGRLDHWQKRLLDLSLRNRLLNFKSSKKSLRVEIDSGGDIENLIAAGRTVRFAPTAGMATSRAGSSQARLESLETEESLNSQVVRALEKATLLVKKPREEIDTTLIQLFRDARTAQEEGGANTLFLAFGYLSWQKGGDSSRAFLAPLVLVPVMLDRKGARSGFTIRAHDDGPRFNPTLIQMLQKDFGLHLPLSDHDLPQDDNGIDIENIWHRVRQSIRDQRGWEVIERVDLATFSFSKHLMWKDLVDRTDQLTKNLVVKQLLEGNEEPFPDQGDFPEESTLDVNYPPEKVYTPLPADSSQLATILAASKGKSFVVIGPPGTGKSQTIANVISQTLGEGKTILFVSEKIAALEVVHRRLRSVGLGDYCLELHSNKANKRGVLDQLDAAWNHSGNGTNRSVWQSQSQQLESLRRDLNTYLQELHKRHDNGLSLFEAFGISSSGEHLPTISFGQIPHAADTRDIYQRQEDAVSQLQQSRESLPPGALTSQVLSLVGEDTWTPDFQDRAHSLARELRSQLQDVDKQLDSIHQQIGASPDTWTPDRIQQILRLTEYFSTVPDIPLSMAAEANASRLMDRLLEAVRRARDIQNHERVLESWWNPPAVDTNPGTKIAEILQKTSHLSTAYTSTLDALDLGKLQSDWDTANKKLFFKGRAQASVQEALAQATQGNTTPDVGNDLLLLPGIVSLKAELHAELATMRSQFEPFTNLATTAPELWQGAATDLEAVKWVTVFAESLNAFIASQPSGSAPSIRAGVNSVLSNVGTDRRTFVELAAKTHQLITTIDQTRERFLNTLTTPPQERSRFTKLSLDEQEALCASFLQDNIDLRTWCPWRRAQTQAESVGLESLVEAVVNTSIAPADILKTFQVNYSRLWARSVTTRTPAISNFTAHSHELKIDEFRNLDDAYSELSAKIVELRVRSNTPNSNAGGKSTPTGVLRREIEKKSRHKPIRTLMETMPELITSITPCFMMSPLSIAQYLPPDTALFDVVVFDEASQIPVWDAVGAIARGKQVIMVGDTKQLPPTSFFNRSESEEPEDTFEDDLPSILDECVASSMPRRHLNWHYRSRHESLIAFSNRKYYDGKLITFPSPVTEDIAVSSNYVAGLYERGTSRTNPDEARIVVKEAIAHLKSDPEDTIGIVTFNLQQKVLIEELLDKERRDDSSLEQFFGTDIIEPVMVKNLENVQGDERDVIFFSTTFGQDSAGKMFMNFGPLNSTGGERRLNVAVTRARKKLRVITSIRPEDIVVSNTRSEGVRDLKMFLDYAQRGVRALAAEANPNMGEADSPFEESVATALRKRGWEIHQQIGVSGFRIDLAVVNPEAPGSYLAGIECDGATYHSSATARDRDQIRESVLRGLGWEILRVWSTDWFYGQQVVLDKLDSKLMQFQQEYQARRLIEEATTSLTEKETDPESPAPGSNEVVGLQEEYLESPAMLVANQATVNPPTSLMKDEATATRLNVPSVSRPFRFATSDQFQHSISPSRFHEVAYTSTLKELITHIIDLEGPIRAVDVVNTVRSWHGWNRTGAKIRERVMGVIPEHHAISREDDEIHFYWPTGIEPITRVDFRPAKDADNQRSVPQIAIPELIDLAGQSAKKSHNHEAIVRLMCGEIGIERLSASVRSRLEYALRESRNLGV